MNSEYPHASVVSVENREDEFTKPDETIREVADEIAIRARSGRISKLCGFELHFPETAYYQDQITNEEER